SRAALTLAQEIAHPYTTASAWLFDTVFHQFLHDARTVQQQTEALIALCNEQGFSALLAVAIVRGGWVLAEQGRAEAGITPPPQGLAPRQAMGAGLSKSYNLALLAEAYGKAGQAEDGLATLSEALTVIDKTGERYYEAELYRLAGELTLRIGEAETERTGERKILSDSPFPRFPVSSPEEFSRRPSRLHGSSRRSHWSYVRR